MESNTDEEFLRRAIEQHGDDVLRFAASRLPSLQEAEDVFQNVFLALFQFGGVFENERHLKCWLLKVTANQCKNFYRKKSRTVEVPSGVSRYAETASSTGECGNFEMEEERPFDVLEEQVNALPQKYRDVIELYYVADLRCREIAQVLDIAIPTVKTRLARARKRIRLLLEESHE